MHCDSKEALNSWIESGHDCLGRPSAARVTNPPSETTDDDDPRTGTATATADKKSLLPGNLINTASPAQKLASYQSSFDNIQKFESALVKWFDGNDNRVYASIIPSRCIQGLHKRNTHTPDIHQWYRVKWIDISFTPPNQDVVKPKYVYAEAIADNIMPLLCELRSLKCKIYQFKYLDWNYDSEQHFSQYKHQHEYVSPATDSDSSADQSSPILLGRGKWKNRRLMTSKKQCVRALWGQPENNKIRIEQDEESRSSTPDMFESMDTDSAGPSGLRIPKNDTIDNIRKRLEKTEKKLIRMNQTIDACETQ